LANFWILEEEFLSKVSNKQTLEIEKSGEEKALSLMEKFGYKIGSGIELSRIVTLILYQELESMAKASQLNYCAKNWRKSGYYTEKLKWYHNVIFSRGSSEKNDRGLRMVDLGLKANKINFYIVSPLGSCFCSIWSVRTRLTMSCMRMSWKNAVYMATLCKNV